MAYEPMKWIARKPVGQLFLHLRSTRRHGSPHGFTLIEMLVVMGIIALLVGLLVPALKSVRTTGRMTTEMNSARQLYTAYSNYSTNNKELLLPGYKVGLSARDQSGKSVSGIPAARYPWRIAPFFGYHFEGMYTNENAELLEHMQQEDATTYQYLISVFPSLGLNSTWLGGDESDGGFDPTFEDVFGPYYLKRIGQAQHPERLIVFGSARGNDPTGYLGQSTFDGYFRIRSPYLASARWVDHFNEADPPADFGYVSPRYDGNAVTGFLDGHTGQLNQTQLKDMRHWADGATKEDWVLTPRQ
ncbi:MAG TPA: prepilin-type N-terminal cleavage/methylation domain-containing protein [Phycisphaerales bacterium]|nr:prepilin-type N-terminal cleavage/methylation domain-containing protein [Phycisphaerales bacterium]